MLARISRVAVTTLLQTFVCFVFFGTLRSLANSFLVFRSYSPQQQQPTRINLECRALPEADMHRISATTMAPPNWTGGHPTMPGNNINTSPLGSNVSATPPSGDTSDESGDDSHSHVQINAAKRPSPEPLDATPVRNAAGAQTAKKAKVTQQKKKKRRDPHEPQKYYNSAFDSDKDCVLIKSFFVYFETFRPVSAYALFFRDTQAAIKGQNPNASFGEVSKIVASMWDALDTDSKNVSAKPNPSLILASNILMCLPCAFFVAGVQKEDGGSQERVLESSCRLQSERRVQGRQRADKRAAARNVPNGQQRSAGATAAAAAKQLSSKLPRTVQYAGTAATVYGRDGRRSHPATSIAQKSNSASQFSHG